MSFHLQRFRALTRGLLKHGLLVIAYNSVLKELFVKVFLLSSCVWYYLIDGQVS